MTVMRLAVLAISGSLALGACSSTPGSAPSISPTAPISATPVDSNPVAAVVTAVPNFVLDAQDTQWNNAQAIAVGALAPNDPGPACVNAVNLALGIPNLNPDGSQPAAGSSPAAPSFIPKVDGPLSLGSVGYIKIQQLKASASGVSLTNLRNLVPAQCYALLGEAQVDALALQVQGAALAGAVAGAVNGVPPLLRTAPAKAKP